LGRECHIQNLLETKTQIAPILINIGHNLTCFGPVQSFDVQILKKERWESHVFQGAFKQIKKGWGSHVLRVLSKIEFCVPSPRVLFIINFRLPHNNWIAYLHRGA
jgi:hypothetical protein